MIYCTAEKVVKLCDKVIKASFECFLISGMAVAADPTVFSTVHSAMC